MTLGKYLWDDKVEIHTMSNRWLNNVRKYLSKHWPDHPKRKLITDEIKRRRKIAKNWKK